MWFSVAVILDLLELKYTGNLPQNWKSWNKELCEICNHFIYERRGVGAPSEELIVA